MKYRSVLFVPGHEEKKIKKAYTLNADLIVLDLESTVPVSYTHLTLPTTVIV